MKKNQIRKSVAALAMAAVVSVSLLGYGCGASLPPPPQACPASSPVQPRVWAAMLPSL